MDDVSFWHKNWALKAVWAAIGYQWGWFIKSEVSVLFQDIAKAERKGKHVWLGKIRSEWASWYDWNVFGVLWKQRCLPVAGFWKAVTSSQGGFLFSLKCLTSTTSTETLTELGRCLWWSRLGWVSLKWIVYSWSWPSSVWLITVTVLGFHCPPVLLPSLVLELWSFHCHLRL